MKYSLFAEGNHDGNGILWSNLTDDQRKEVVNNFFERQPIGGEKTNIYYHFDENGKCKFAD